MSGSRLPGDSGSADRKDPSKKRVEARVGGELRERVEAAVEDHDSEAELVRAALREYLPEHGSGPRIRPPEDEELRTAFRTLQRLARHRGGRVPEDEAASAVAQELGIKAPTVRNGTFGALADEGYLIRERGLRGRPQVRVFMPEDAERIAAEIEDANGGES